MKLSGANSVKWGPLVFGLLVVCCFGAKPSWAKTDYRACVAECETKVPKAEETERNCEATIQNVAHDLLIIKSFLETTKLCRGSHVEACREWHAATVDALTRVVDAIGVTPGCMTVKVDVLKDNLWPLSAAKACVGDGIFTDFHDYLGGQQQVVDDMNSRNLHYPLVAQPIDGLSGDTRHAPVCMDGMRPIRQYFPSLIRMHDALAGMAEYQVCMAGCRKPTRFEERLYLLPDRVEAASQRLEEMKGAFQALEAQREAAYGQGGGMNVGCLAFQRAADFLAGADSEVAELRKGISAGEELGEALDEASVVALEDRIGKLEESLGGYDLQSAAKDCEAETRTAMELVTRKQKVLDELSGSKDVALEASLRFGAGDELPASCESTAECPIPYRCLKGKCKSSVDVDAAHEALTDAEKLLKQARSVELMGKGGMVERAGERLDSLEVRLREIKKTLSSSGWSDAVGPWGEEFKNAQLAKMDAYTKDLEALLESLPEPEGSDRDARECRRGRRSLETCRVDLQKTREALEKADPLQNAKWFNLKVLDADRAVEECKADVEEKLAACDPGEGQSESNMLWVWVALGVLVAGAGGAAAWFFLRKKAPRA